jgi:hypothetical protein
MTMDMQIIDPGQFGVSFSSKQCRNFQLDETETLSWLLEVAGFRRFRLMSYWDEHEKKPGQLDFGSLDRQIKQIAEAGGVITLCLGARQPRWPENHWPNWAWQAPKAARSVALMNYLEVVVNRYKNNPAIVSYQLENEALLKQFGRRPEIDRRRLRAEYNLVRRLDPTRPVVMSTSTSWGIPLRRPLPTIVGFSYYQIVHGPKGYSTAWHTPRLHRTRKHLIKLLTGRPVFIHELQLEPWGPESIWNMSSDEQDKSMSVSQIAHNINLAQAVKAKPVDLWGGEWWYWRHLHGDDSIWMTVKHAIHDDQ